MTSPSLCNDSLDLRVGNAVRARLISLLSHQLSRPTAFLFLFTDGQTDRQYITQTPTCLVCMLLWCLSPHVPVDLPAALLFATTCVCINFFFFVCSFEAVCFSPCAVVNRAELLLLSLTTRQQKVIFTGVVFLFIVWVNRLRPGMELCGGAECVTNRALRAPTR